MVEDRGCALPRQTRWRHASLYSRRRTADGSGMSRERCKCNIRRLTPLFPLTALMSPRGTSTCVERIAEYSFPTPTEATSERLFFVVSFSRPAFHVTNSSGSNDENCRLQSTESVDCIMVLHSVVSCDRLDATFGPACRISSAVLCESDHRYTGAHLCLSTLSPMPEVSIELSERRLPSEMDSNYRVLL